MNTHFFSFDIDQEKRRPMHRLVDARVFWSKLVRINDRNYFVGEAQNPIPLTQNITREEYDDTHVLEERKVQKVAEVKERQAELYLQVEGENDVNFKKAKTKAYVYGEMADFDKINFQKAQIRERGNALEFRILSCTALKQLDELDTGLFYDINPPIEFNTITVGSFMARFTAEENTKFKEILGDNPMLEKDYTAMMQRTHIRLNDETLHGMLYLLELEEVLSESPLEPIFESRKDELVRPASGDEAFRASLS